MSVFRYRFLGIVAEQLSRQVPGTFNVGAISPNIFVDVTAEDNAKDDLDEAMARLNYAYDSTDPELAPAAQAKQANEADTAEGKVDTIEGRDPAGLLLYQETMVGGILTSVAKWTYDAAGAPVDEVRVLYHPDGSVVRQDMWLYSVQHEPDGSTITTKKAVP
jgi:hypothetical protein